MPDIYLYAELLINIRQLTLYASLNNPKSDGLEGTKILLSSDKQIITALHDGESASIYLPTQISGTADIKFPLEKRTELCGRLVFEDATDLDKVVDGRNDEIEVPWPATSLNDQSRLCCKVCNSVVVEEGKIQQWKDLPSENWADLMDLWFCHKPPNDDAEEAGDRKGFGTTSQLEIERTVGLVDTTSLFIHKDDCTSIEVTPTSSAQATDGVETNGQSTAHSLDTTSCAHCSAILGSLPVDASQSGCRFYKSRLKINNQTFSPSVFFGAQLLQQVQTSISRRVVVHAQSGGLEFPEKSPSALLIWIFNPDIYYSSSRSPSNPSVIRAMKVFYQSVNNPAQLLDSANSTVEEVLLPQEELDSLQEVLTASTQMLPLSAKTFQAGSEEWSVGLLERYEALPSGRTMMDSNLLNQKAPEEIKMKMNEVPEGWKELFS